jgi:alkylation response protein AidB-like acyl-CoA dehydrogenase
MSNHRLSNRLTFSDEQGMLLDTATEFFRQKSPISVVRDLLLSEHGYDPAVWQEMIALGWTGLAIPEANGGSGLGLAAAVSIAEPMGRALSATPWLATTLYAQGLTAAPESLRSEFLTPIAEGSTASVAVSEPQGTWDLHQAAVQISDSDHGVSLQGTKTFVLNAEVADYLLISGSYQGEPAAVIVLAEEIPDSARRNETIVDETRRSSELLLDGITVPADRLIVGAQARNVLDRVRDAALLLISAEASGGSAAVLDVIVEYLNTRKAFGRKIGSYQGLKHPTVDILIGLERARSHVYHAASLLDAEEDALVALRMAKAQASETYAFAGDRAVQFHGGFGFTWECDAQLYLRRAMWSAFAFGDALYHRRLLADELLG